ncbi:hypothetical protein SAMN05660845_0401 [Flavobacterium swingsii]|jgi:hypothetical protein|uniref:Uncharacterized protein n=1 Tax=Flavobacterium swingsii TaxID=498292 RepID=A0A1I0VJY4_9FLAO|nr:hypothetical protein [Flavobacterium swingsii]SFA75876.1 hypothetical protein SAMN05660845_0401 [Flavobacterium swingsii]
MEFISIGMLLVFSFIILVLVVKQIEEEQKFNRKIKVLELLIMELNTNLVAQNQKVKLSDDLKIKFKESNIKLSKSILEMNLDLFEISFKNKT